ncbi:restriction endonuclease subunit S [uncultured Veillonella sp.]|uniref:restriction endonuclease subunit S n=1 Tax=uncultured Veillonella sp. TaxID=159268 RepID=UPI0028D13940|nr:restriction endonuclease subunit S [uncultured Veillonella sp.]
MNISEFCKIYTGTGFPIEFQGKKNGKYPFYKVSDISVSNTQQKIFLDNANNYIDEFDLSILKGNLIPAGTIVFAKIGEALKLNKRAITSCECLIDNNVIGIKPDDNIINLLYFYYYLLKIDMLHYSESTTLPSVRKSTIEKIKVKIPPIDVQNKRVIILNICHKIIKDQVELIHNLDLLVKSRFVEIFKNNKAHIAIGELFQVIDGDRGKNYPKATDFFDEGYCLFLNAKNVTKNGFCFDTVQFITQQKDEQLNKGRVLPEDIILTTRGTVGNIAYCDIKSSHKHMRINSGMVILRSKDIIYDVDFITYVLSNQINYGKEISGSAQPQLPISKLKDIIIPFPEIFLQKDFGYLIKQINKLKFA